jgi:hypothetical protein
MTIMGEEKPVPAEKPIGPSDAFDNASRAAKEQKWDESTAWSLLGLLALKRREDRPRGR